MFLQHVKYQDLLTGYVRELGKKMWGGVNLTVSVSLKLKYIKIEFILAVDQLKNQVQSYSYY